MNGSSFNPRVVLGLLLFGALAFVATLYFIGSGQTGSGANDGGGHAASRGLTGYAALAELLEAQGLDVRLARSPGALDDEALLILTPPLWADGEEIAEIVAARRFVGPTLLILPKWNAVPVPPAAGKANRGWVTLAGADTPLWLDELGEESLAADIVALDTGRTDWSAIGGLAGALPDRRAAQGFTGGRLVSLVRDSAGRDLVGYLDDGGCYPVLDSAAGLPPVDPEDCDTDRWNLTLVAEPDLFDNYGMAERNRALLAARIVELAREDHNLPILFDLTLNGIGAQRNLLTLAFTPPFLAATLCLALALLMVGWRAFRRFGPPLAGRPATVFGKRQLVANGAGFIRRTRRLHLLAEPYVDLVTRRLARALGLRTPDPAAIDAALARHDPSAPSFSTRAAALRNARRPADIVRAAHALRSIERILAR